MQTPTMHEAATLIDADRGVIFGEHVQKWNGALLENVIHYARSEDLRVAMAARVRMRADSAYLDEPGWAHSLTGHRKQASGVEDPEEGAQGDSSPAKGAGFSELGELNHSGSIFLVEKPERDLGWQRNEPRPESIFIVDHLSQRTGAQQAPSSTLAGRIFEKDTQRSIVTRERTQCFVGLLRLVSAATQRTDIGGIASREAISNCQLAMAGAERMPDRIVEQLCVGHNDCDEECSTCDAEIRPFPAGRSEPVTLLKWNRCAIVFADEPEEWNPREDQQTADE